MRRHWCFIWVSQHAWVVVAIVFLGLVLCAAVPGIQLLLDANAKKSPPAPAASADAAAPPAVALMVVGDWGREGGENQTHCAAAMAAMATKLRIELDTVTRANGSNKGGRYLGVVSTGDNFYPDGIASLANFSAFHRSFLDVYTAPSMANLTWHAVMGNHDYHGDVDAQVSRQLAQLAAVGNGSRWDALTGGYREFSGGDGRTGRASTVAGSEVGASAGVLGICFVDTNPWVAHYRAHPKKYNMSRLVNGVGKGDGAAAGLWAAWETAELAALERCLHASNATWRIVVGHHPILSYSKHHGSQPELSGVREVIERLGAVAYLNGHDHNLQHVMAAARVAAPGSAAPSAVHYITSGAGSQVRDDVDGSMADAAVAGERAGSLKFAHGTTPGFVVLRATHGVLRITFHSTPTGALLHTEVIPRAGQ